MMTTQSSSDYPKFDYSAADKDGSGPFWLRASGGAAYHCGVWLALENAGYSFRSGSKADYSNLKLNRQQNPRDQDDYSKTHSPSQKLTIQLFSGRSAS
jgi:hypothetical protein